MNARGHCSRGLGAEMGGPSVEVRARSDADAWPAVYRRPMHHARLKIVDPCAAAWDAMPGDDRRRHCERCDRAVVNVSAMRADEARELLAAHVGQRLCVRYAVDRRGDVVFRAPARPPPRVSLLTPLLLAACAAHGQGYELEEPTPPEAGDWCSPEEEAEQRCVGEPLKPEPVFADPGPDGEPEASASVAADPRACEGPLAVEVPPEAPRSRSFVDVLDAVPVNEGVGVRLGGMAVSVEVGMIVVSKAELRRERRQLRREARRQLRRERAS